MERELRNFLIIWHIVVACLTYVYFISSRIPKGKMRLLSILPIIPIFTLVPLILSSAFLGFYFSPFLGWFANTNLLLFAFGKDDTLTVKPSMSLLHFILLTTLPVKIQPQNTKKERETPSIFHLHPKFPLMFVINVCIWLFLVLSYVTYKQHVLFMHPAIVHFLYSGRMLFGIQVHFAIVAAVAKPFLGQELQKQFDNPHLSTSLQNFWGRRWNLMASSVLRGSVYEPTRSLFTKLLGKRWSVHPAVLVTYFVSGLFHELIHFYVGRRFPTWEVTWFFIIHGVCQVIEMEVKKIASRRGWKLHPAISIPLTVGFVMVTGIWLCYAELIHWGCASREVEEFIVLLEYVKQRLYAVGVFTTIIGLWCFMMSDPNFFFSGRAYRYAHILAVQFPWQQYLPIR